MLSSLDGSWNIQFRGQTFKLAISNGYKTIVTMDGKTVNLEVSNNKNYKTSEGWLKFAANNFDFYIKIKPSDIEVVAFMVGIQYPGTVTKEIGEHQFSTCLHSIRISIASCSFIEVQFTLPFLTSRPSAPVDSMKFY